MIGTIFVGALALLLIGLALALGKPRREWVVVYRWPDGGERRSIPMTKKDADAYLRMFDDAMRVERAEGKAA